MDELHIWVDAAYGVHNDMKSQTGGVMSFGHGMIHCRSNKDIHCLKVSYFKIMKVQ